MQDRAIEISLFEPPNSQSSPPKRVATTVSGLIELLTAPPARVSTKGNARAWSPIVWRDDPSLLPKKPKENRLARNAVSICALGFDIDNPEDNNSEELEKKLASLGWIYVLHWSYTAGRYRLVIPLAEDLTPALYPSIYESVRARLGLVIDDKCKDLARLFWLPSCPASGEPHPAGEVLGKFLYSPAQESEQEQNSFDLTALRAEASEHPTRADELVQLIDGTLVLPPGYRNAPLHALMCSLAGLRNAPSDAVARELLHRVLSRREGADNASNMVTWMEESMSSYERGQAHHQSKALERAQVEKALRPEEHGPGDEWKKLLTQSISKSGTIQTKSCFANLAIALDNDPAFRGHIRWNLLRNVVEVTGGQFKGETIKTLPFSITSFFHNTWYNFSPSLSPTQVGEAIFAVAQKHPYDPVRSYLENLPEWDGVTRVPHLLLKYANAVGNNPWIQNITTKFLISAVARTMDPGCQVDTSLLLVGGQGGGKTSFVRALGGEFAVEMHIDVRDKDALMVVMSNWFVELSELASFGKSDTESSRSFLSRTYDQTRLPYARATDIFPRRCVFIGTTNSDNVLRDPHGHRRFWPVSVGRVDVHGLKSIRDQLWAEALGLYRAGVPWWLTQEEAQLAAEEASLFEEGDGMYDTIIQHLLGRTEASWPSLLSVSDIALSVLGKSVADLSKESQSRIRSVLKNKLKLPSRRKPDMTWVFELPPRNEFLKKYAPDLRDVKPEVKKEFVQ